MTQTVRPLRFALCDGHGIASCGLCRRFTGRMESLPDTSRRIVPHIRQGRSGQWHCEDWMPTPVDEGKL